MITNRGTIDADGVLRFERRYDATVEEVWSALTDPDQLARWFFRQTIEPRVGGATVFHWGDNRSEGTVLEYEPPKTLAYEWGGEDGQPWRVRWQLTPDGDGTMLVFQHFLPDAVRDGSLAPGWHWHLDRLDGHLGGEFPPPEPVDSDEHFEELQAYYAS